jgi:hypothetical protein
VKIKTEIFATSYLNGVKKLNGQVLFIPRVQIFLMNCLEPFPSKMSRAISAIASSTSAPVHQCFNNALVNA